MQNRPKRPRMGEVVESSEEEGLDDTLEIQSSCDSNSSFELDPDQTVVVDPVVEEVYHLPAELVPRVEPEIPDYNSEDDDDHTGVWRDGDLESLIMALNHFKKDLKGKFFGSAGGKKRRDDAWKNVAGNVTFIYVS